MLPKKKKKQETLHKQTLVAWTKGNLAQNEQTTSSSNVLHYMLLTSALNVIAQLRISAWITRELKVKKKKIHSTLIL